MLRFLANKISDNIARTPDGYLICRSVPFARTGYQDYLRKEVYGLTASEPNAVVRVFRSPDQVFCPLTMASFEGKPVTNNHPPVDLDSR
jgi:hypothetical protein